jgi:hypothetical protein
LITCAEFVLSYCIKVTPANFDIVEWLTPKVLAISVSASPTSRLANASRR